MQAEARFRAMGSDAHVVVVADDPEPLVRRARERVDQLESLWSRFRPDSEISLLNEAAGNALGVSRDTFALVRAAVEAWKRTRGRFDPTVLGDVLRAGYDDTFDEIAVRGTGGHSHLTRDAGAIELDPERLTVRLAPGTGFDPGGIGKGFAADVVLRELMGAGAAGACVNVGGDLALAGAGPDGDRWIVSLDPPMPELARVTVALSRGGVATSSVLKRAWTADGVGKHHVMDVRTGRPLATDVASVSVLAAGAAGAEVAATFALASQGREADAMSELGCDGVVVYRDGRSRATPHFDRFVIRNTRTA